MRRTAWIGGEHEGLTRPPRTRHATLSLFRQAPDDKNGPPNAPASPGSFASPAKSHTRGRHCSPTDRMHRMPTFLRASLALAVAAALPVFAAGNWSEPQPPIRLYGNSYYVGSAGLSSVLIDSGEGLILLDGTLPKNAPMIEANIRALGFKPADIKYILNSHAHFDHAGGIAALAKDSGATVVVSPSGAQALRAGHAVADDPQAADADGGFPQ
jgi:hypothetical protein